MKGVNVRRKALGSAVGAAAAVVAVTAFPLAAQGAGAAASSAGAARLSRDPAQGRALPVRGAVTQVEVRCRVSDGGHCSGRLRLLPRGRHAVRRVGKGAIAERRFKVAGGPAKIRLRLSRHARRVLRRHLLNVEVRLISSGRTPQSRRATLVKVTPERIIRGGKPQVGPPQSQLGVNKRTYSWSWDIPATHLLLLPEFTCPKPYYRIETNGLNTDPTNDAEGKQANITVSASKGTGYGGFEAGIFTEWKQDEDPDRTLYLHGWEKGTVLWNSIWAPVFEEGHFSLSLTCTESESESEAAWMRAEDAYYKGSRVFPWKH